MYFSPKITLSFMTANSYRSTVCILLMLLVFTSCESEAEKKSKMLTKKWAYEEFKMNNETYTSEQLGNPYMEFFKDGKYKLEFGPMSDEGTWKVEGDELITNSAEEEGSPNHLEIQELTESKLVLFSDFEGSKAYITLVPAKE